MNMAGAGLLFLPGFPNNPADEALLILDYLLPKVLDPQGFHPDAAVLECDDLYGEEGKWKAWFERTGESQLCFFTKRKKGDRRSLIGHSVWKSQKVDSVYLDLPYKIYCIGYKRIFSYRVEKKSAAGASSSENKAGWVMHEFRLQEDLARYYGVDGCGDDDDDDEYVICCVRKRGETKSDGQIQLIHGFDALTIQEQ